MSKTVCKGITAVPGICVGHATNLDGLTGCTVVLCEKGAVGGVDQRGGAPGTRETDLLRPLHLVQKVRAVLLAGGASYGLSAADGVTPFALATGEKRADVNLIGAYAAEMGADIPAWRDLPSDG
jgi:L-aminopeptidase/D-esterase-like protein